jgi:ATP-dependent Clp protease ATP-binding subunit ClpX
LGARGLRSICEVILNEAMFELPTANPKPEVYRLELDYAISQFERSTISKLKAVS